jgi:hypothetical protein
MFLSACAFVLPPLVTSAAIARDIFERVHFMSYCASYVVKIVTHSFVGKK